MAVVKPNAQHVGTNKAGHHAPSVSALTTTHLLQHYHQQRLTEQQHGSAHARTSAPLSTPHRTVHAALQHYGSGHHLVPPTPTPAVHPLLAGAGSALHRGSGVAGTGSGEYHAPYRETYADRERDARLRAQHALGFLSDIPFSYSEDHAGDLASRSDADPNAVVSLEAVMALLTSRLRQQHEVEPRRHFHAAMAAGAFLSNISFGTAQEAFESEATQRWLEEYTLYTNHLVAASSALKARHHATHIAPVAIDRDSLPQHLQTAHARTPPGLVAPAVPSGSASSSAAATPVDAHQRVPQPSGRPGTQQPLAHSMAVSPIAGAGTGDATPAGDLTPAHGTATHTRALVWSEPSPTSVSVALKPVRGAGAADSDDTASRAGSVAPTPRDAATELTRVDVWLHSPLPMLYPFDPQNHSAASVAYRTAQGVVTEDPRTKSALSSGASGSGSGNGSGSGSGSSSRQPHDDGMECACEACAAEAARKHEVLERARARLAAEQRARERQQRLLAAEHEREPSHGTHTAVPAGDSKAKEPSPGSRPESASGAHTNAHAARGSPAVLAFQNEPHATTEKGVNPPGSGGGSDNRSAASASGGVTGKPKSGDSASPDDDDLRREHSHSKSHTARARSQPVFVQPQQMMRSVGRALDDPNASPGQRPAAASGHHSGAVSGPNAAPAVSPMMELALAASAPPALTDARLYLTHRPHMGVVAVKSVLRYTDDERAASKRAALQAKEQAAKDAAAAVAAQKQKAFVANSGDKSRSGVSYASLLGAPAIGASEPPSASTAPGGAGGAGAAHDGAASPGTGTSAHVAEPSVSGARVTPAGGALLPTAAAAAVTHAAAAAAAAAGGAESEGKRLAAATADNIDALYDPWFLDDSSLQRGKHRVVMNLPGMMQSVISYVTAKDLKDELNAQFRARHEWMNATMSLSKIRAIKHNLALICRDADLELSTVALAVVYFEKLLIQNIVEKANRKLIAAVCVVVAYKFNELLHSHAATNSFLAAAANAAADAAKRAGAPAAAGPSAYAGSSAAGAGGGFGFGGGGGGGGGGRAPKTLKPVFAAIEKHLGVRKREVLRNEFAIYALLQFSLHVPPDKLMPHFNNLCHVMERSPHDYAWTYTQYHSL